MKNKQALWSPATHMIGGATLGALGGFAWDEIEKWFHPELKNEPRDYFRPIALGILGALPGAVHGFSQATSVYGPEDKYAKYYKNYGRSYLTPKRYSDVKWYQPWFNSAKDLAKISPNFKNTLDRVRMSKKSSLNSDLINTDVFGRVIWEDPNTNFANASAITNTLDATSSRVGSNFVTPVQIAGTLVNAGIGAATGWVVGKTLGAFAGIRPETQKTIQDIGMWGGVMNGIGNQIR